MSHPPRDASVAVLTASGRGAIAVVRVWGPRALEVADAAFRPVRGLRLVQSEVGRLRFGRMGAGLGDEVVAVLLRREPPEVEIHSHGGSAAVNLVLGALEAAGAGLVSADAWLASAFASPLSAQAWADLRSAPTVGTAEILLDQAHGALGRELDTIIELLGTQPTGALAALETLTSRAQVGLRLLRGWRVVLAGRPNVGKSRLFNALVGFDRAIVDPTPGTTRDVVTATTAFAGWPVEIADTAGLRDALGPIEAEGITRARQRQHEADVVLLVLDRSEPLDREDRALIVGHPSALRVGNKADLPAAWCAAEVGALPVSAERGDGLEDLIVAIASRLVPEAPPPGVGVPFRERHARLLHRASQLLRNQRTRGCRRAILRLIRSPEAAAARA